MIRTRLALTHDLFINGLAVSGSRVVSDFATPSLDNTSEEEEDEMALNWRNKGLRELMAARNKGSNSKEVPKS